MKKLIKYTFLGLFIFLFCNFNVNAAHTQISNNDITVICNVGTTNGLLYSNEWNFNVVKLKQPGSKDTYQYSWSFKNSNMQICPSTGCTNDWYATSQSGIGLNSLFSNAVYYNIFSQNNNGVSGVYTDSSLRTLLEKGSCPKYIYVASSRSKQKIAFIFASKEISNAKEIFEDAGFSVEFELDGGKDLSVEYKKLYEDQVKKMKDNIEEFKNNNYDTIYNDECSKVSKFGQISINGNLVIEYYNKYRNDLFSVNPSYDFSSGDAVLAEYKTYKCASKVSSSNNGDPNLGTEVTGCDVVPEEVRKWIKIALNFVKYVSLILVIVLGTLDFIKAAGSGEADSMKKAGQAFLKRVVAVILLFLLPMLVELILDLINLYGTTGDCFGVLE